MTAYQLIFSILYVNYVIIFAYFDFQKSFKESCHNLVAENTDHLKDIKFQEVLHFWNLCCLGKQCVSNYTCAIFSFLYRQCLPMRRGNLKRCCKDIFEADIEMSFQIYLPGLQEKQQQQQQKPSQNKTKQKLRRLEGMPEPTDGSNMGYSQYPRASERLLFSGLFLYVRYKESSASLSHTHLGVSCSELNCKA